MTLRHVGRWTAGYRTCPRATFEHSLDSGAPIQHRRAISAHNLDDGADVARSGGTGSAYCRVMKETAEELDALQNLLDSSHARSTEHLREIIAEDRRLTAVTSPRCPAA